MRNSICSTTLTQTGGSRLNGLVVRDYLSLIATLIVAIVTYVMLSSVERFITVDRQLLQDSLFEDGNMHWIASDDRAVSYENNVVTIFSNEAKSWTVKQSLVVSAPAFVRFSIDASAEKIEPSNLSWSGALAALFMFDENKERFDSNGLFQLKAPREVRSYEQVIYLPESAKRIEVVMGLYRSEGKVMFRSPALALVAEKNSYKLLRAFALVCWISLGVYLAFYIKKRLSNIWISIILLGAVVLLAGVLSSEASISALSGKIGELMPDSFQGGLHWVVTNIYSSGDVSGLSAEVSKLGHFAAFVLLGVLFGFMLGKVNIVFAILFILAAAFATEALQMLVNDRTASLKDVFVDLSGGGVGLCVGWIFRLLFGWVARQYPRP